MAFFLEAGGFAEVRGKGGVFYLNYPVFCCAVDGNTVVTGGGGGGINGLDSNEKAIS